MTTNTNHEFTFKVPIDDYEEQHPLNNNIHPTKHKSVFQGDSNALLYGINDKPPILLAIFLGFQQFLTMCSAFILTQLLLAPRLCILPDDEDRAFLVANGFFVSGFITIFQATFGSRLPILQGPSFSFLLPAFAILSLEKFRCPAESELRDMTKSERYDIWTTRMHEVQGAIMMASMVELFIGLSGAIGFFLRFIGPLTVGPLIASIGLSMFSYAGGNAGRYWPVALLTFLLITLLSQVMNQINVPVLMWNSARRWHFVGVPLFKLLPVFLSVAMVWLLCLSLTLSGALPAEPGNVTEAALPGLHHIRTDSRIDILHTSPWIRVPYPFQFGWPTISLSSVLGMVAGVMASMLESVGDYYACARLSGAGPPPTHAVNRGIAVEGLGCIVAGAFGTGTGSTSYTENVSAIGITKVGSRLVIQLCGVLMIVVGVFTKFGALFATIPDPVIGGLFCVMSGMVAAVGIANLQFVNMNSTRNLFVFGVPLVMGLIVPAWLKTNEAALSSVTPYEQVNQVLTVLLTTSMFVTGCLALLLDNLLPGTVEERGLIAWKSSHLRTNPEERVIVVGKDDDVALEFAQETNGAALPQKHDYNITSNGVHNRLVAADYVDEDTLARRTYTIPFGITFSSYMPVSPNYKEK